MHDVHGVHVVNSIADAVEDASDHALVFQPVLPDVVKKRTVLSIF